MTNKEKIEILILMLLVFIISIIFGKLVGIEETQKQHTEILSGIESKIESWDLTE